MSPTIRRHFTAAPRQATSVVPPSGCDIVESPEGPRITATCRHVYAFYYVPFMAVVTFAISGVILGPFLHGQTPNLTAVLLGTLFLSFFVPFWWTTFCYIFGRTELLITHDELRAFTGIGSIGRTLRLPLRDILDIEMPARSSTRNSMYVGGGFRVWLPDVPPNDRRAVYFGRMLTESRRDWMAAEMFRRFEGSGAEPG